jgi:hypothetical protein
MTYRVHVIMSSGTEHDFMVSALDIEDAENYVRTHIPEDWSTFTVESV